MKRWNVAYSKFRKDLEKFDMYEEIKDYELCERYTKLVKEDKDLPNGITWNLDEYGFHFYRDLQEDDEIKQKLDIENAKSLRTIASALKYFQILSIVCLSLSLLLFIIFLFFI